MTKRTRTRNALFTSIISLLLCVSMLVGTTFAWFTDEVKSGRNMIAAGNLDVELYHSDENETDVKVDGSTKLFNDVVLWEPGAVLYDTLQVKNVGSLALKYDLNLTVLNETVVNGYKLSDVIKVGVLDSALGTGTTRDGLIGEVTNWIPLSQFAMNKNGIKLEVGGEDTFTLVLYWQPNSNEIDNRYNMNNENQGKKLELDIGVNLFATQVETEADSFGDDYDANAPTLLTVNGVPYKTVEEVNAALAAATGNVTVVMDNVDYVAESGNALTIPANVNATLEISGYVSLTGAAGGAGIYVSEGASLTVSGDTLIAKGNAGVDDETGGSGIGGPGSITIDGVKALTAEGYGKNGYGIGSATSTVTIKNSTVVMARGGYYNAAFTDTSYVKDAKEGAPAIGGAVITLNDTTVKNALGGSKAAGIGARFWNGTTITIANSTIENVEGGASAAGIGGSRVKASVSMAPVTVTITDSTVTAKGGYYGAGIGSGYDTYCASEQPLTTINISGGSVINAQGGKYAAGIGTGYHVANLSLNIADTATINAKSGEKFYKATYTLAQDVGYGVVDPAREGIQATDLPTDKIVTTADELATAAAGGYTDIYLAPGEYNVKELGGKNLTLSGSRDAVLKIQNEGEDGCDYGFGSSGAAGGSYTINGVTVDTTANTGNYKGYCYHNSMTFNDCAFVGAYSVNAYGTQTFNNCEFDFNNGYFWTWGAAQVNFNGCTFNGNSKTILAHGSQNTVININNCTFAATAKGYTGSGDHTAAVEMDPTGTNTYTVNITNSTINENYAGWTRIKDGSTGHTIKIDGKSPASDADSLDDALKNGNDVVLMNTVTMEADKIAPYGNKYGVALNGGVLDGNGNELEIECYGDDYGIMTTGGTIKNLTIQEGCRAVMIMYPTTDMILDNVNIGGDGVLYPINTGESGEAPVKLIVTNSTLAGWVSYGNGVVSEASFTNVNFEQGTYYNNIYGRVLKPYTSTTLTDCRFVEHMNLDLSALVEGEKITITNCTVNGQAVTLDVFTVPNTDAEYDTELFTVDLPSWADDVADCIIIK